MTTQKPLTGAQVNKYGFYLFGSSTAAMIQMTYMTIFMTDYIGIPAAVVATTLLVARVLDLIIGIVSGGIIEKVHMRWGKYRSWLLILRWVIVFSLVCSFFDTGSWPLAFKVGVSFVGYILLNASMSFTTNAYYALGPALAGANLNDRFRLSARGAQFMCLAMLLQSSAALPLVNVLTPVCGAANAFLVAAIIFAIPYLFSCQIVSNLCKECDPSGKFDESGRPHKSQVTVKDMIQSVAKNKQLLVMFLAMTVYYVGFYVFSNFGTYYFSYIVGDFNLFTVSMTVTTITGFLASLVMPKLGGMLGKKKAFIAAMVAYAVICVAYYPAGSNWILYTVLAAVGGAAVYLFSSFGANYFVDCGEYYLYKTGVDTRDVAIAMYSVPMKIGMMLGGAIATYGLAALNFEAHMGVDQTFYNGFMSLRSFAPAILILLAGLFVAFGYKITDKDAQMYAEENAKRAAAKAAEAAEEKK